LRIDQRTRSHGFSFPGQTSLFLFFHSLLLFSQLVALFRTIRLVRLVRPEPKETHKFGGYSGHLNTSTDDVDDVAVAAAKRR